MKRKTSTLVALLLTTGIMAICLFACGKEEVSETTGSFGTVWSAPSTVKILQDDIEYEDKGDCELVYNTVKNEYESVQLIITATKDIASYYLEATDLTGEAGTLSAENIVIYNQYYVPVTETYYFDNETTYIPDALIPLDAAAEYGETTAVADTNAGLWITIYIPEDQEAGTYTGTFILTVDEEEVEVPVTVVVNDYTLSGTYSSATLFSWRYARVGAGEMDTSVEMMEYYYEYFLSYGISLQTLPLESLTGEEYIACLDEYWDELTTFCLLKVTGNTTGSLSSYSTVVKEQVLAMAAAATADRNYFEKVFIYSTDEPDFTSGTSSYITEHTALIALLKECADIIAADKTGIYDDFKAIEGWRSYVEDIPRIVPLNVTWLLSNQDTEEGQAVLAVTNCICPVWHNFTEGNLEKIYALCEKYDLTLWWYGCCNPKAPGATYHIGDTNLLSSRTISWLQQKYGIEGNLYWDAAAYTSEDSDILNEYIDVYTYPYRKALLPAGDGFLTYPGLDYGIYGPLPSLRLMSIRDGEEEYMLLEALEEYYESLEEVYGDAFSATEAMNYFYSLIYYDGYCMTADGENNLDFTELRAQLIDAVCWMSNGNDFAFSYEEAVDNVVAVSVFAAEGVAVSINGNSLERNADGYFTFDLDLMECTTLSFVVEGIDGVTYTFDRFIGNPTTTLQDFADASVLDALTVSEESEVSVVSTTQYSVDGSAAYFLVNGVVTGDTLIDMTFTPYASIGLAALNNLEKLTDYNRIRLILFNPGEDYTVTLKFYSGSSYVNVGDYDITSGKNTITVSFDALTFSKMDEIDRIVFEFSNTSEDGEELCYQLYVDRVIGLQ